MCGIFKERRKRNKTTLKPTSTQFIYFPWRGEKKHKIKESLKNMKCNAHPEINDKLMVNWKIICFGRGRWLYRRCCHLLVFFFFCFSFFSFMIIISIFICDGRAQCPLIVKCAMFRECEFLLNFVVVVVLSSFEFKHEFVAHNTELLTLCC